MLMYLLMIKCRKLYFLSQSIDTISVDREKENGHNEYVLIYVDDLLLTLENPAAIM